MTMMQPRISMSDFKKLVPNFYRAVSAIEESAETAGLDECLIELIKLRASQINGCAYCVQYHITNGRSLGIPDEKLNLVVVWREAGIFTEREQAALAWTEALTLIADSHVPDDVFAATRQSFTDVEMASLTAAICTINVWNRICVSSRFAPEI